jgi:Uma2 family endonuclease
VKDGGSRRTTAQPGSARLIAAADWAAIDEELCRRIEIIDGRIAPMPAANPRHSMMVGLLWRALLEQVPEEFDVTMRTDLRLCATPLLQRKPDVVVLRRGLLDGAGAVVGAQDVVLVAEVESPGSTTRDRYAEPVEYAAAGIPHYWRIERRADDAWLHTYSLNAETGVYLPAQSCGSRYVSEVPFGIDLDVQSLLGRRDH